MVSIITITKKKHACIAATRCSPAVAAEIGASVEEPASTSGGGAADGFGAGGISTVGFPTVGFATGFDNTPPEGLGFAPRTASHGCCCFPQKEGGANTGGLGTSGLGPNGASPGSMTLGTFAALGLGAAFGGGALGGRGIGMCSGGPLEVVFDLLGGCKPTGFASALGTGGIAWRGVFLIFYT